MCTKYLRAACWAPLLSVATLFAAANPSVVEAVKSQNATAVNTLLRQHADVNAAEPDGATALHWAAHWDDGDTAQLLIRAGAHVNARNQLGMTPLLLACTNGSAKMIQLLLAAGADSNAALPDGETPLMVAARTGPPEIVSALLDHGANVNAKESSRDQTALMWAVAERHPDIVRILLAHGADVHARSRVTRELIYRENPDPSDENNAKGQPHPVGEWVPRGGSTPFLFAARQGDIECAKLLLAAGANVNDTAPDGTSALVMAAYSDHGEFAAFLLDQGADPNAAAGGYSALHIAVLTHDVALVRSLLAHRANPNARLTKGTPVRRFEEDLVLPQSLAGATPFLVAAHLAEVDMMKLLAAAGANTRLPANNGLTPLMAAVNPDRRSDALHGLHSRQAVDQMLNTVQLALQLGSDINAIDEDGNTALHLAASKGSAAVIQLLVEKGAKVDLRNKRGQTPLNLTEREMVSEPLRLRLRTTADLLRKLGARE